MKQFLFTLLSLPLWGLGGLYAQSGVTVTPVSANYGNKTVTFSVSWLNSSRTGTHNSKVWLWVDFVPVTGNVVTGSWSRALVSGTPTASSGTPTREASNDKGFWLQGTTGSSGTYNATVMVSLSNVPAKFNWCAYASDYPPNAASYSNGTYTLKGTQPFVINGNTITGNQFAGVITSMTDATSCPGGVGRDVVNNGGTCAPGLTVVGGGNFGLSGMTYTTIAKCRDLTEDDAIISHCGIEVDKSPRGTGYSGPQARAFCQAKGWDLATYYQIRCLFAQCDVYASGCNITHPATGGQYYIDNTVGCPSYKCYTWNYGSYTRNDFYFYCVR